MQFTFDEAALRGDEEYDGYAVLVATVPKKESSADQLFTRFKQQIFSEHVNREFKGPVAVRPIFLHTPERVEALVFVLLMALTAYFLLQRIYRKSLPKGATPKERRTTTQTILRAFNSYMLLIHRHRAGREVQPTRLNTHQRELLQQLGFPSPAQVLSQILPRGP